MPSTEVFSSSDGPCILKSAPESKASRDSYMAIFKAYSQFDVKTVGVQLHLWVIQSP